ncbi:hypothetical protein K9M41_03020 [Candidatus Gracilibacteria bacterium]|nr:hypothetical protein [Candidatus Gracilibacteria bacterium]
MKDKILIALVGFLVILVALFIMISRSYTKDERLSSFRDSLTTNVFGIELVADDSMVETEEDEVMEYEFPLFRPGEGEFVLTSNRLGSTKEDFYVRSNTCPEGVRIIGRVDLSGLRKDKGRVATINISGLDTTRSRATYQRVVNFSEDFPSHILHLPSHILYNNDSVFPEYRISNGKYADNIRYDVMCY